MSYYPDCPLDSETRRLALRDAEDDHYDHHRAPFECDDANQLYGRVYREERAHLRRREEERLEEQREEERQEMVRAEARDMELAEQERWMEEEARQEEEYHRQQREADHEE